MKLAVKTLKGEVFHIEADDTDTVQILKEKIAVLYEEYPVERQKLIHGGKVLKDTETVAERGLKEQDFLVIMVSKAPAAPAAPKPVVVAPTPAPAIPIAAQTTSVPTPSITAAPQVQISAEAVQSLVGMGFPEPEARAALSAAMGNPDIAYDMLTGSIPMMPMHATTPTTTSPAIPSTGAVGIEVLRQHPQFNSLKQLIQSNPAALPQVMQLLGQQNPALLEAIQQNEAAFFTMMNEPITETPVPPTTPNIPQGFPAMPPGGMPSPAQMMGIIQNLPPDQREAFARTLGLSGQELQQRLSMIASIPEDQLAGLGGGFGGGGGGGAPVTITLNDEEMAAVNRLCELTGVSRQAAAQAYLVCDKNEEAACNYLFDNGDEFGGAQGEYDEDMYN